MTTGTVFGPSGLDPDQALVPDGLHHFKTWSGSDGKYEYTASGKRAKWNNYSMTRSSRIRGSLQADFVQVDGTTGSTDVSVGVNGFGEELSFTDNEDLALQSKLLGKVRGHDFHLGVFAGELGATTDTVVNTLGRLVKSMRALKRGNFTDAALALGANPRSVKRKSFSKDRADDLSGSWLELQYGWKPLLGDVFEASKAFEKLTQPPRVSTVRASVKKSGTFNGSAGALRYKSEYSEQLTRSITYEMVESLSAPRSLGLLDPYSVVWELIPYSFVVDWFIPIGTYIENYVQIPTLEGRFMTVTARKRNGFSGISLKPEGNPPEDPTSWTSVKYPPDTWRSLSVLRIASATLSPPLPGFNNPISSILKGKRLWNAIALASQVFTR